MRATWVILLLVLLVLVYTAWLFRPRSRNVTARSLSSETPWCLARNATHELRLVPDVATLALVDRATQTAVAVWEAETWTPQHQAFLVAPDSSPVIWHPTDGAWWYQTHLAVALTVDSGPLLHVAPLGPTEVLVATAAGAYLFSDTTLVQHWLWPEHWATAVHVATPNQLWVVLDRRQLLGYHRGPKVWAPVEQLVPAVPRLWTSVCGTADWVMLGHAQEVSLWSLLPSGQWRMDRTWPTVAGQRVLYAEPYVVCCGDDRIEWLHRTTGTSVARWSHAGGPGRLRPGPSPAEWWWEAPQHIRTALQVA